MELTWRFALKIHYIRLSPIGIQRSTSCIGDWVSIRQVQHKIWLNDVAPLNMPSKVLEELISQIDKS
jgi:hypothetical protein